MEKLMESSYQFLKVKIHYFITTCIVFLLLSVTPAFACKDSDGGKTCSLFWKRINEQNSDKLNTLLNGHIPKNGDTKCSAVDEKSFAALQAQLEKRYRKSLSAYADDTAQFELLPLGCVPGSYGIAVAKFSAGGECSSSFLVDIKSADSLMHSANCGNSYVAAYEARGVAILICNKLNILTQPVQPAGHECKVIYRDYRLAANVPEQQCLAQLKAPVAGNKGEEIFLDINQIEWPSEEKAIIHYSRFGAEPKEHVGKCELDLRRLKPTTR